MCCKSFRLKLVSFFLTLALGVTVAGFFLKTDGANVGQTIPATVNAETGSGHGIGSGSGISRSLTSDSFQIISKPRPTYTDAARQNQVQGTVVLRVVFPASGRIGSIAVVKGLPNGLTETAIEAAKNIKFQPAKRAGKAVDVTKVLEYTFTLY